jgi:hypothetical protein
MIGKIAKVDINGRGQFGEALQPCNLQPYIALPFIFHPLARQHVPTTYAGMFEVTVCTIPLHGYA